jgi:hypothetical protein
MVIAVRCKNKKCIYSKRNFFIHKNLERDYFCCPICGEFIDNPYKKDIKDLED